MHSICVGPAPAMYAMEGTVSRVRKYILLALLVGVASAFGGQWLFLAAIVSVLASLICARRPSLVEAGAIHAR